MGGSYFDRQIKSASKRYTGPGPFCMRLRTDSHDCPEGGRGHYWIFLHPSEIRGFKLTRGDEIDGVVTDLKRRAEMTDGLFIGFTGDTARAILADYPRFIRLARGLKF